MTAPFDYFAVFADMRTGSNFLEANLNALDSIACHGEAFNPSFVGYPHATEILGFTRDLRDDDPVALVTAIREQPGVLGGFRFFNDHDPRILDMALQDPRCAKIILTRNPLDSYVSLKIARATGQWKLQNIKRRREAQADFDAAEFTRHVATQQAFQEHLLRSLQCSGQTAFYLAYEDLQDLDVINGLIRWLGITEKLGALDDRLKRQNPSPAIAKVTNPDDMASALADLDRFNLHRTPNFEPRRGPAVPSYVAGAKTGLIYLPVKGGPVGAVINWLAALDDVDPGALGRRMNQKNLRQWRRQHPGHRSFTVLRHPVARIHAAFCAHIVNTGFDSYPQIRQVLRQRFKLPIPRDIPNKTYGLREHRAAFDAFLDFLGPNLAGQTAIRIDASWCSQSQVINGFADFQLPDYILREDDLGQMLPHLARETGHPAPPIPEPDTETAPYSLADIYDGALEQKVSEIYQRDYLMFGFGPWQG